MDQPMQPSSRARSRSWGAGPWATTTTPLLSPGQQMKPRHERTRSATSTYSPPLSFQQRHDDTGGMTEQAQHQDEELCGRPATETETEGKAAPARPAERQASDAGTMERVVRRLEREAAAAKQREMKMLESLVQQTKDLEEAKIALEEARLEVATLRQQQQEQQGGAAAAAGPAPQAPPQQWSVMDLMFGGVDEEINGLRARLRATTQAEERSRKAAEDLTAALSAVTMEAKQVKSWLSDAQAEAEAAAAEAGRLRGLLQGAEAELWLATEQVATLTSQWKEAAAGWRAREKALAARARAAEDDAAAARGDGDALRLALERAAEDASAAAEALEAATADNAGLRDAAAEKERAIEALRRENEALRESEAAARERARELEAQKLKPEAAEIPLVEKWRREAAQGKLGAAAFLDAGRVLPGRKDRMFASLSNLAELKSAAAAAAAMDDYDYEFDHLDVVGQYGVGGGTEHAMKHKKRRSISILRKFGDLFRRRSMYKPDLEPVLHNHY
ncbi:unnamed protein product [Urochloa humidicola]